MWQPETRVDSSRGSPYNKTHRRPKWVAIALTLLSKHIPRKYHLIIFSHRLQGSQHPSSRGSTADGSLHGLGWWVLQPPLCATTFTYAATPTSNTHLHAITTPPFPSPISWTHACTGFAGLAGLAVGHGRLRRLVSTGPGRFSSGGLGSFQSP